MNYLFVLLFFSGCNIQEQQHKQGTKILEKSLARVSQLNSIQFDFQYSLLQSNSDTLTYYGTSWLKLGGKKAYKSGKIFFYDITPEQAKVGSWFQSDFENDSVAFHYSDRIERNKQDLFGGLLDPGFLIRDLLNYRIQEMKSRQTESKITDTLYHNENCISILFLLKDEENNPIKKNTVEFIIRKNDFLPIALIETGLLMETLPFYQFQSIKNISTDGNFDLKRIQLEKHKQLRNSLSRWKDVDTIPRGKDVAESEVKDMGSVSAKDIALLSKHGETYLLNNNIGKVTVVDFWFRSCVPCWQLMKILNKMNKIYDDQKVTFIGINSRDSFNIIHDYKTKNQVNYETYNDRANLEKLWGIETFPTTVILRKDGSLHSKIVGFSSNSEKEIEKAINSALKD